MATDRLSLRIWLGCAGIFLASVCLALWVADFLSEQIYGIDLAEDFFRILEGLSLGAFALWGIATIFGLVRSRPWARTSAVWIGRGLFVVALPEIAWNVYVVRTAPDVGWSWQILWALVPFICVGSLLIFLFRAESGESSCQGNRGSDGRGVPAAD